MDNIQLSQHFGLHEFLRSETADRLGIDMAPPPQVVDHLRRLCETVLEPARVQADTPFMITSGWRPLALNAAVGGSDQSYHLHGLAADVVAVGLNANELAEHFALSEAAFDKLIVEFDRWVHVQIPTNPDEGVREQLLAATRGPQGQTVYQPWQPA